jgi:ABC-2 type transport system ATP-binding protein/lipopolysaccharide transport system ATP-binding protein
MTDRISLTDVTVDFPIYDLSSRSLRHRLVLDRVSKFIGRGPPSVGGMVRHDRGAVLVRALDGVSFVLADGDRVGLIGHNGAGKTTLLRVAAGIYEPTAGQILTRGRVMTLFNMMEGLVTDDTGLEMIRVRGALLGLPDERLEEITRDIAEFCELGEYLEMPVRTYSTGMLVRLAFAITTAVSAEILIMDEFIGGGDAAFFERAQRRLKRFVEEASVLLVATHGPDIVRQWCTKALLLNHGKIVDFGPVEPVLQAYERLAKGA